MMKFTAQSTIEYAVLIAVLVAAIVGMNLYMRRSVQANLKMTESRLNALDWTFKEESDDDDEDDDPTCARLGRSCEDLPCCNGDCVGGVCKMLK